MIADLHNRPLAVLPQWLPSLELAVGGGIARGATLPRVCLHGRDGQCSEAAAPRFSQGASGSYVAVIFLSGPLLQYETTSLAAMGGTSLDSFARTLRWLAGSMRVQSIVLSVHSAGGTLQFVQETADTVYAARQSKLITAVVNSHCAGSALWIAANASRLVCTPGGSIGGVGVVGIHQDASKAEETAGVKTTLISHPARKAEGHPFSALAPETRERWEKELQTDYRRMLVGIARGRRTTPSMVASTYGRGAMLDADEAKSRAVVDRVSSLQEVVAGEWRRIEGAQEESPAQWRNRLSTL